MFNQNSGYSLADIAAAVGGADGIGGGGGAWWLIILFLFGFMGWGNGNNGWGPFGGGSGSTSADVAYNFDMSGLKDGLTDLAASTRNGFYDLNTGMLNSFAAATSAITGDTRAIQSDIAAMGLANCQNTNAIVSAINTDTFAGLQNTNALTAQLAQHSADEQLCCCQTQNLINSNFAQMNYNLADQACQNRQATLDAARDIIDNANANTRSILDFLVQDRLTALTTENSALKNQISQAEQNAYLVSQLGNKAPIPAYVVANPYAAAPFYGCGCQA